MKNKGFTLVELLAVIVMTIIILGISVPSIINELRNAKEQQLEKTTDMIIAAARNYVIDYDIKLPKTISLSTLCNEEDLKCPIKNSVNNTIMNGYVNIDDYKNYSYSETDFLYLVHLFITLNLDGGSSSQTLEESYIEGDIINLTPPTKPGYTFVNWNTGCESCLSGNTYTVGENNDTITALWESVLPVYAYTGESTLIDDGEGNWRIKFLTSGTFTPTKAMAIDVFLVGGGGGGGLYSTTETGGCPGGGGGYTATYRAILEAGVGYPIVVGAGGAVNAQGGTSSAFSYQVAGGYPGIPTYRDSKGGFGGSGGGGSRGANDYNTGYSGGTNGGNGGGYTSAQYGIGQGTTTREFGESTGTLYSGGGGGSGGAGSYGGAVGGGSGNGVYGSLNGTANTGGGGAGAHTSAGVGGSGIVVIRNIRGISLGLYEINNLTNMYTYTGSSVLIPDGDENWRIKFFTGGTFTPTKAMTIDVFLVGGGGGGALYSPTEAGGCPGGGGGYTATHSASLEAGVGYSIVIGAGGGVNAQGGTSSAFSYQVAGGYSGIPAYRDSKGGDGGSGGGGSRGANDLGTGYSGGSDGGNGGGYTSAQYGIGQGTTTREFGESTGTLYAGGGGGSGGSYGGAGGGGSGSGVYGPLNGKINTGGGGGGASGAGGSGIVVIRNHR